MRLPNVDKIDVNLKTAKARIVLDVQEHLGDEQLDGIIAQANELVKPHGFKVRKNFKNRQGPVGPRGNWLKSFGSWGFSFVIAAALVSIFLMVQHFGLGTDAIMQAEVVGDSKLDLLASIGFALLMGLVASLSSCLALVGSLVMGFGSLYGKDKILKPNLLFHGGRIGTFLIMGLILGAIGGSISLTGTFVGVFQIVISVGMVIAGLSILGARSLLVLLPGGNTSLLGTGFQKKLKTWRESTNAYIPIVLGAITFILPCGFTQSMQLFALSSSSPLLGGLSLAAFAIGTSPVLFMVGLGSSWSANRNSQVLKRATGLLMLGFAVFTFLSATKIVNVGSSLYSQTIEPSTKPVRQPQALKPSETGSAPVQVVEMRVDFRGFAPEVISLKPGVDVKWIVWGDQVSGCTNAIMAPDLNVKFRVKKGYNEVFFKAPSKLGLIDYSCWMGMVWGQFKVES